MPRNKGKNPFVAAALTTAALQALQPKSESKALVLYKSPDQTKKTKPQGRQRSRRSPSEATSVGALASASTSAVVAPVQAGMMMRGANYQFGAAPAHNGQTGVRLSGRQIWFSVQGSVAGTDTKSIRAYGATDSVAQITFDPDDTKTMPPPMTALSQCFARYILRKCRVVYTPACATSTSQTWTAAVTTDAAAAAGSTFTPIGIMEQSNSFQTPCWAMASIDVPCDNEMRYTYQSVADASLSTAEERQDHAFGLFASFQSNGGGMSVLYGYVHLEYVIDFYEVIAQSNENSLRRLEERVRVLKTRLAGKGADVPSEWKSRVVSRESEQKHAVLETGALRDDSRESTEREWVLPPTPLRRTGGISQDGEQRAERRSQSLKS